MRLIVLNLRGWPVDGNLVQNTVRANRYLSVLRATLKDALAEGLEPEHEVVRSLLFQIDGLLFVLGEEDTNTEKFLLEGERMIADDARSN